MSTVQMPTPRLPRRNWTATTLALLLCAMALGQLSGWRGLAANPLQSEVVQLPGAVAGSVLRPSVSTTWHPTAEDSNSAAATPPAESAVTPNSVVASGTITYDQRLVTRLSTRVAGTVWSVEKRWGDRVHKGDVLAIVEAVEVGKYKAEFLDRLALAETRVEQVRLMEQAGSSIPFRSLRQAQFELREARIFLLNAEQTLVNIGLPLHMEEFAPLSDEQRAARIQFLGLPAELTKGLDPEETTTNLVPIIAPHEGVVVRHEVGDGEWTAPAQTLFEIADLSRMWIKLEVSQEDAARIRHGQKFVFQSDGLTGEFHAQICWISTEVNELTRTLAVRGEVANPILCVCETTGAEHRLLRANTTGTARILVGDFKPGPTVAHE